MLFDDRPDHQSDNVKRRQDLCKRVATCFAGDLSARVRLVAIVPNHAPRDGPVNSARGRLGLLVAITLRVMVRSTLRSAVL
jgi:hypothetical protein